MPFWPALHWSFQGDRVLLPLVVVDSFTDFIFASLLTILVCASERFLTLVLDRHWEPQSLKLSRRWLALWRTWIYSMVTLLRICCVLILTTFHIGIITVVILTLSATQFFIELENLPKPPRSHPLALLSQPFRSTQTRPRSRSKPDGIFIHPTESNIARADAAALELGLGGDTERVRSHLCSKEESAWEAGTGKDQVRAILAGQLKALQPSTASEREPFLVSKNDEESE